MHPRKLLFICSRNKFRSLTAEKLYEGLPGYEARSAGTQPEARVKVTAGLLGWADIIFCMEKSHRQRLQTRFPDALEGKELIVLHVPDDYPYMDPSLIEELLAKLSPHIDIPDIT